MNKHRHPVHVPGCFRCELSADEAADVWPDALDEIDRLTDALSEARAEIERLNGRQQALARNLEEMARERDIAIARIADLEEELDDADALITRQAKLLTDTVNVLRGTPPEMTLWSHHDVATRARAIVDAAVAVDRAWPHPVSLVAADELHCVLAERRKAERRK